MFLILYNRDLKNAAGRNVDLYPQACSFFYKRESWNLIMMQNVKSIAVKRCQKNISDVDTL